GAFDTALGVGPGTEYGAAEETDYLIRALLAKKQIYYDPATLVFHPRKAVFVHDEALVVGHGCMQQGWGYVVGKAQVPQVVRPLCSGEAPDRERR
ncbi:MAG: hypothetical protein ACXW1Q_07550, partial [Halobacteriota archaeon]